MASQTINFITWNVNGLKINRDQKFQKLQNADVVFFQETHIGEGDEHIIESLVVNEWHVYYTKYKCRKGTAILVRKRLDFEYISDERDNRGRYVLLKCKLEGQLYTLVSVYNHKKDTKTLENLSTYLQSMTTGLLVIGGDFNTVLNQFIDKDNSKEVTDTTIHRKLRCCVKKLMRSLQLVDVWRRKNPVNQNYTFNSQVASRLDYFFVPEECLWHVTGCEIRDSGMRDHCPVYLEINNAPTILFQRDFNGQSLSHILNKKKDLLSDETGSLPDEESPHAVSEVDIVSAVQSLQVSDTPRPDGIPVSFYKDNIQEIIPYIKTLFDRIHRGALNCSEKHFNETVKSPHDDSQHFFNVDYLIIATILARRLDDFLESPSKGRVLKNSATVMITPKTFCTEMRLSCIRDEIEKQKQSDPTLYQDFLIVKNLLRDAPESEDVSIERDKLLDQGCPLTPVLITLALKCFTSASAGHFIQHDILVFKESVILCIQPEDLEEITAALRNGAKEVFYIKTLSGANGSGEQLKSIGNESKDEDWNETKTETFGNNSEKESEAIWSRRVLEGHEEEDPSMEGDGRQAMYAVVTLTDSGEVLVAASNWLTADKKQCYWPPFKSTERCMEAVEKRFDPEKEGKSWEKLNICFHKEYGTFEKAKEGQKEFKEQKERTHLLKRQRIESTQQLSSQPVRMSADDNDLLQMLRDIKSVVQENSTMLKKLLNENTVAEAPSSTCVPSEHIQANLNLPLRTFADVDRTIKELNTATARKKYVKYLSGLEGFGPKDVIKNIMQKLLTDDLAKDFNWQGRGDKRPFSQLGNILEVIRDAASKKKVSSADCEAEIKKYLSYTADRLTRKRAREEGDPGLKTDGQD